MSVIVVAFFGLIAYILFGVTVRDTDDISYYLALSGENSGDAALPILGDVYVECPYELPKLSELQSHKDYRFNHMAKRVSIFQSDAYVLIISFDENAYQEQKDIFAEKYTYCSEQTEGFADVMPGYEYTMDGFKLRAVEGGMYPHEMLFIGTCDVRQEIAVIYFYDQDLDYIEKPLGKFIETETGWSKVV